MKAHPRSRKTSPAGRYDLKNSPSRPLDWDDKAPLSGKKPPPSGQSPNRRSDLSRP